MLETARALIQRHFQFLIKGYRGGFGARFGRERPFNSSLKDTCCVCGCISSQLCYFQFLIKGYQYTIELASSTNNVFQFLIKGYLIVGFVIAGFHSFNSSLKDTKIRVRTLSQLPSFNSSLKDTILVLNIAVKRCYTFNSSLKDTRNGWKTSFRDIFAFNSSLKDTRVCTNKHYDS